MKDTQLDAEPRATPAFGRALFAAATPEVASGEWALASCRPVSARKHRRKRFVVYQVTWTANGSGPRFTAEVLAKSYGADRGANGEHALRRLWEAGFCPPSPLRVPRSFGYAPAHGVLLQEHVPGLTWADHLADKAGPMAPVAARAATWLARLESSGVPVKARPEGEAAANVRRFAAELGASFAASESRIADLARDLLSELDPPGADATDLAPSHGDYHPKNVLLDGRDVVVIDFDTFAAREPAWDVGYAIGQLLIMSYLRLGSLEPGRSAALSFWEAYEGDGVAPWPRVRVHVARTLMQSLHFELCTFANGRLDLLALWPELMERWLAGGEPQALLNGCG